MKAETGIMEGFVAVNGIRPYQVVCAAGPDDDAFGEEENSVSPGVVGAWTGNSYTPIGVSDKLGQTTSGRMVDVIVSGRAEVEVGAPVRRGERLGFTNRGLAVPVQHAAARTIGVALASASQAGQVIPLIVAPSVG